MSFTFPPITEIGEEEWDRLVRASPDGWVFSLHGWQRLVTAVEPWGFQERGFAVMEGRRLLAVMPLHWRPSHGITASSGWGGSGPVIDGTLGRNERDRVMAAALAHAEELARQDGAETIEMSCWPVTVSSLANRWAVNPFELHGYEERSRLSQVIDLSVGEEALWNGLSQTTRRWIRKAQDRGFNVRKVDWADAVDSYYQIHCETYRRTGVEPHPRTYFAGIARYNAPSGASVLFAALNDAGKPAAFHNDARLMHGAYYHTGCSHDVAQELGLNYLLMWEAIADAARSGFLWYDVGWIFPSTADSKLRGLTDFKTRFGGEPHRAFYGVRRLAKSATAQSAPDEPAPPPLAVQNQASSGRLRRLAGALKARLTALAAK